MTEDRTTIAAFGVVRLVTASELGDHTGGRGMLSCKVIIGDSHFTFGLAVP